MSKTAAHVVRAALALLCAVALWLWVNRDRVRDASPRLTNLPMARP